MIPHSVTCGERSYQFFDIALVVFRSIDEVGRENLQLATYIRDWSNLLLNHIHDEVGRKEEGTRKRTNDLQFVGRDSIDHTVFGISALLQWCIRLSKSLKKPLVIKYVIESIS